MDQWANISAEQTHLLKHFVYLVGLHIYYKMRHGPYNIKLKALVSRWRIAAVSHRRCHVEEKEFKNMTAG